MNKKKKISKSVALIINTHSSNQDCLDLFFIQLKKYKADKLFKRIYIFSESDMVVPDSVINLKYNINEVFVKQMRGCLSEVKEEFVFYCNEDYLLYDKINKAEFLRCFELLRFDDWISYLRFVYSDTLKTLDYNCDNLELVPYFSPNCFSQVASIWKKDVFLDIHNEDVPFSIGEKGMKMGHFEEYANQIVFQKRIAGVVHHKKTDKKRGLYHYDSAIFPHIASAIVKGKWNTGEYPELKKILKENKIDVKVRGEV